MTKMPQHSQTVDTHETAITQRCQQIKAAMRLRHSQEAVEQHQRRGVWTVKRADLEEVDCRGINVCDRGQIHNNEPQLAASGGQLELCTLLVFAAEAYGTLSGLEIHNLGF